MTTNLEIREILRDEYERLGQMGGDRFPHKVAGDDRRTKASLEHFGFLQKSSLIGLMFGEKGRSKMLTRFIE